MTALWVFTAIHTRLTALKRGQAFVLIALGIVVFIGFAGLAVDAAILWTARLRMQSAADAGALAAADALLAGNTTALTAAQAATAANGFSDGQTTRANPNAVVVTVNNPPTSGTYSTNAGAVEVIVRQVQPTYFLKVMPAFSKFSVSARAVASPSPAGCIYSLDPSGSQSFMISRGSLVSNCGVLVDSTSSSAFYLSSGASLTASGGIGVVGGAVVQGAASPQPVTGILSFPDPFASKPAPARPIPPAVVCTAGMNLTINMAGAYSEPHGCYSSVTINNAGAAVDFRDGGDYAFPNGMSAAGTVNLDGGGNYYFGKDVGINAGTFNAGGTGNYYYAGAIVANAGVTADLMPGYYGGGINVAGAGATVNLAGNGVYYFGASVVDNTTSTIQSQSGNGAPTHVMLYFGGGSLVENNSAMLNLSAPLAGAYEGILLFQDRANSTAATIDAGASVALDGALYLPDAALTISGAYANAYSLIIAYDITLNAGALSVNTDYSSLQDGSPIKQTVLVE